MGTASVTVRTKKTLATKIREQGEATERIRECNCPV